MLLKTLNRLLKTDKTSASHSRERMYSWSANKKLQRKLLPSRQTLILSDNAVKDKKKCFPKDIESGPTLKFPAAILMGNRKKHGKANVFLSGSTRNLQLINILITEHKPGLYFYQSFVKDLGYKGSMSQQNLIKLVFIYAVRLIGVMVNNNGV